MIQKVLGNKKFVLVLEDVWEAFEIEDVGIPLLVNGKKLLMTSRSRRVCEIMECRLIELKPLFEEDALHLFIKESKCQINDSMQWGDIVRSKIEEKVYKALKLSYNHLPNNKCRQCFLYCALFPEDHIFIREKLIEYWIGVGLIDEQDCRQAELDKGNVILDELIHVSLLEIIVNSCAIKMHDVIRDMARMNVNVGLQFEDSFDSVRVLKMLTSFSNLAPHYSKVKILELHGNYNEEHSNYFFANMQSLNVLNIHSVKSISVSLTNLGNLGVLIVNYCSNLECISSLAELVNLRHLNISKNNLKGKLQGIERLVNLRVLDLSDNCSFDGSTPIGVEAEELINLEKLQVLKVHFEMLFKMGTLAKIPRI